MQISKCLRKLLGLYREDIPLPPPASTQEGENEQVYDRDGLRSVHDHSFMSDPLFCKAYSRGVLAAAEYGWHWRVHIGLWAARSASRLNGDFVECGVNRGFLASAIMEYLNWDSLGKTFYLLDAFTHKSVIWATHGVISCYTAAHAQRWPNAGSSHAGGHPQAGGGAGA